MYCVEEWLLTNNCFFQCICGKCLNRKGFPNSNSRRLIENFLHLQDIPIYNDIDKTKYDYYHQIDEFLMKNRLPSELVSRYIHYRNIISNIVCSFHYFNTNELHHPDCIKHHYHVLNLTKTYSMIKIQWDHNKFEPYDKQYIKNVHRYDSTYDKVCSKPDCSILDCVYIHSSSRNERDVCEEPVKCDSIRCNKLHFFYRKSACYKFPSCGGNYNNCDFLHPYCIHDSNCNIINCPFTHKNERTILEVCDDISSCKDKLCKKLHIKYRYKLFNK